MEEIVTSKKFSLGKYDYLKALLMATGTPVIEYLIEKLNTGTWSEINWAHALAVGASAGLLYLSKNFFTNSHATVIQK